MANKDSKIIKKNKKEKSSSSSSSSSSSDEEIEQPKLPFSKKYEIMFPTFILQGLLKNAGCELPPKDIVFEIKLTKEK